MRGGGHSGDVHVWTAIISPVGSDGSGHRVAHHAMSSGHTTSSFRLVLDDDRRVQIGGGGGVDTVSGLNIRGGVVVSKDELIKRAWSKAFVDDSNLKTQIRAICRALCERDGRRRFVVTTPRRSYNFCRDGEFRRLENLGSIGRCDGMNLQVVTCLSARTDPQGSKTLLYRRNPDAGT
jgi:DNA-binding winged helix-turn-helix (wHTH) protein